MPRISRVVLSGAAVLIAWTAVTLPVGASEPTREQIAFFETNVRPLLAERCYKCHGPAKQESGLRLDASAAMLAGGETGPAIVPGEPQESLLVSAVNYELLQMPPDGKLSAREIALLIDWVKLGAPMPPDEGGHTAPVRDHGLQVTDDDRQFWSFRPVVRLPVPDVTSTEWCRNPIDQFVLSKLEQKRLSPSAAASNRELLRRVYFDVIGLPPTPEEVDAFLADPSDAAYEAVIDRLLASPHYGERWGRHWLDLVRYAQTNGYERDNEKPHAWRYRDYVVRAFNEDKPYDQFVLDQLAGDELADVTPDSIIATGFYRLGVWDDEPDDMLLAEYDELNDILQTTGETFLGLTVGCARCHDHKFDPVPQEDYYRLLALFRNIELYGEKESDTHLRNNHRGIFTPLTTSLAEAEQWIEEQNQLEAELRAIEDKLKTLADDAAEEKKQLREQMKSLTERMNREMHEMALSVRESGSPPATNVLVRGNPLTPGREVEPGFLQVLDSFAVPELQSPADASSNPFREALAIYGVEPTCGRRLQLARWIVDPANPLTPRVIVNRLWHYHFGRGIVPTPSDFGRTGLSPSHPVLLDWLASELIRGGWQLKRLHKLILLSATYRQSSRVENLDAVAVDPGNTLLWRQNLKRIEAEAIRDSILAVSGSLNSKMEGRGIFPELSAEVLSTQSRPGSGWDQQMTEAERSRRSVYIYIKRTLGVPLMETFDMPTPDKPDPSRPTTTIAPQALILLNSSFLEEQSARFAQRLVGEAGDDPARQIDLAFRLALSRLPSAEESQFALDYLQRQRDAWQSLTSTVRGGTEPVDAKSDASREALKSLCLLIFNLNEFVYVD